MHMIATNLVIWINVLILETEHEVLHYQKLHDPHHQPDVNDTTESLPKPEALVSHVLSQCSSQHTLMGKLLEITSPFLFPCTIEYSLICAAILYTMWQNIEEEHQNFIDVSASARAGKSQRKSGIGIARSNVTDFGKQLNK